MLSAITALKLLVALCFKSMEFQFLFVGNLLNQWEVPLSFKKNVLHVQLLFVSNNFISHRIE